MTVDPTNVVAAYFNSWKEKDFDTLRSVVADDVTFVGPLGQFDNADSCRKGIEGFSQMVTDVVVEKRFADGPDVLTWFELHTTSAPCPTANWSHVENGKITAIRVTFDPARSSEPDTAPARHRRSAVDLSLVAK